MKDIKMLNIILSFERLKDYVLEKKDNEAIGEFFNYLFNVFAFREGFAQKDTAKDAPHLKKRFNFRCSKIFL
jgi:hypothetical protein